MQAIFANVLFHKNLTMQTLLSRSFLLKLTVSLCLFSAFFDPKSLAQPADLPWAVDPSCNSIITTGITAMTCGTTVEVDPAERYTFGMVNIIGALPNSGRIDVTAQQAGYHHPSWHIDSIGNVFGIAMDVCGNTFLTASSNYGADFFGNVSVLRYGGIGGGAQSLQAAGTVYKIDGATGQASVFSVLPQQAFAFTHFSCEGITTVDRTTGPGLGNIVFHPTVRLFYVSNFEDGRIYRIDEQGVILDSYDPIGYDNGAPGTPGTDEIVYGLAVKEATNELFFGTSSYGFAATPRIFSILLNPDGSFQGTIDNTNLPASAIWNNYVGSETLHHIANESTAFQDVLSLSDLHFTPSGDLLAAIRVGCGDIHTSYNHGGTAFLLEQSANGLYNTLEGIIYTGCEFCSLGQGNEAYGGVAVFENPNGTTEFVLSSADMLGDSEGPHGICTQAEGSFGMPNDPASPAGLISYGTVDDFNADPKGVGGDVEVFLQCNCTVTCPTELTATVSATEVCDGSEVTLSATITGGNSPVTLNWLDADGNTVNPVGVVLSNSNCAPLEVSFYVTAVCEEDPTIVLTDTVTVTVFTNDIAQFVEITQEPCLVGVEIDPACEAFLTVIGDIPAISPGDTGTVVVEVASTDGPACASIPVELSFACPACSIDSLSATVLPCADTTYFVELDLNVSLGGTAFTVTDQAGNDLGTFNYADLPVQVGPLLGDSTVTYTLTVADASFPNCTASVEAGPQDCSCGAFEMPNVFSPNGDGLNDTYYIVPFGKADVLDFRIFNRWGEKVHDSIDPWDGNFNKKAHASDVFAYIITVQTRCEIIELKGDVTLLR